MKKTCGQENRAQPSMRHLKIGGQQIRAATVVVNRTFEDFTEVRRVLDIPINFLSRKKRGKNRSC